ncbi:hypothetical protein EUV02_13550 [Polymorphobacter arshaanensis]|uniref:Helix-hairpin-helix domain-containing protein n=1 Tax=Glacieibacterium arshaanense TaxID=2511025 RepID=A0A4Y9EKT6_9SPHN|nr:hypothetical protein [Polymorphobacter arshaanensis]TFU01314.1 hypothetical protein EUV02_13550 [Polymorphobacter arshaanensis]
MNFCMRVASVVLLFSAGHQSVLASSLATSNATVPALASGAPASTAVAAAPVVTVPTSASEVLTNETILKLLGVGLSNEAIIAKIHSSKTAFNLGTDQLIELKKAGVPSPVIAAMIEPQAGAASAAPQFSTDSPMPNVAHFPGVYLMGPPGPDQKMKRIVATASNQAKVGNIWGYALTMGIASMTVKVTIPGAHARVQAGAGKPVFYFYFDESMPLALQSGQSTVWSSGNGNLVTSPSELSLVRFDQEKDRREAKIGSVNIGGAKTGVMDKDRIPFDAEMIAPGIFKVTVNADLTPGEFGFIQATGAGSMAGNGAGSARVFDFSIPTY